MRIKSSQNYCECDFQKLAALSKEGDADALAELIMRMAPFINNRAETFKGREFEKADLVQEGMLGLLNAVRNYDASKGAAFYSYASSCITNKMIGELRKLSQKKKIPQALIVPSETAEQADAYAADPQDEIIARENEKIKDEKIKILLSKLEYNVFRLYISGYSYEEMATVLSVSKKSIGNAVCRMKAKIRKSDYID